MVSSKIIDFDAISKGVVSILKQLMDCSRDPSDLLTAKHVDGTCTNTNLCHQLGKSMIFSSAGNMASTIVTGTAFPIWRATSEALP
ncbi:hypothetical protein ASG07_15410 [Sphingomonas sp. Leaf343]|nr:hypothetical protein ASG07_15410 [Sphingomonas sp. Leaf343]